MCIRDVWLGWGKAPPLILNEDSESHCPRMSLQQTFFEKGEGKTHRTLVKQVIQHRFLRTSNLKNTPSYNMMSKVMVHDIIFQGQHIIYRNIYFLSIWWTSGCNYIRLGGEGSGKDEVTFLMKIGLIQPRVITSFFSWANITSVKEPISINQDAERCWQLAFLLRKSTLCTKADRQYKVSSTWK